MRGTVSGISSFFSCFISLAVPFYGIIAFSRHGSYLLFALYFGLLVYSYIFQIANITPHTTGAAALCQMEAIVGQFFTAVLVAWPLT